MNIKRNGFIILENIISLSIVALISSLVVIVFSTSIFCIEKSKNKLAMLNIAKSEINKLYNDMSNKKNLYNTSDFNSKEVDGFIVESNITSILDYYNCYKLSILVKSEDDEIKIESYMVRK